MSKRDEHAYVDMIISDIPDGYEIYRKPFPENFDQVDGYGDYQWMPNFGFMDKYGNPKQEKLDFTYRVLIEAYPGGPGSSGIEFIANWDASENKIIPYDVSSQTPIQRSGKHYKWIELDLADPPCGWR